MFLGCLMDGIPPGQLPFMIGMAKEASTDASDAAYRILLQAASSMMDQSELRHTVPAFHLKLAAEDTSIGLAAHRRELAGCILSAARLTAPLYKRAAGLIGDVSDIIKNVGTVGMLGAGAVGAAGGAGLWALKSQLAKNDLESRQTTDSADYYRTLTQTMHDQLRRKYPYHRLPRAKADPVGDPVTQI